MPLESSKFHGTLTQEKAIALLIITAHEFDGYTKFANKVSIRYSIPISLKGSYTFSTSCSRALLGCTLSQNQRPFTSGGSSMFPYSTRRAALLIVLLAFLSYPYRLGLNIAIATTSSIQTAETKNAQTQQIPETIESLRSRISAHIAQSRFASALWGVKILSLDTGKIFFEHNPQKYFNPASNAKLYTAALALERLGPDYRIKSSIYSTAKPDASGTLKGDLILYGRGDPTMAARLNDGDYLKGLEPLVNQVVNSGVKRIQGDLIADESYFAGPPFGAGWEWDDLQAYYGAEFSSLTINDNSLDLFVKPAERAGMPCRITTGPPTTYVTLMNRTVTAPKGTPTHIVVYRPVGENIIYASGKVAIDNTNGYYSAVAVHNPAGLFASLFKDVLAQHGITITGKTRVIDWKYREVTPLDPSKLVSLGSVESMPLAGILRETLKPSQNLYAQLLLLQVGANASRLSGEDAGTQGAEDSHSASSNTKKGTQPTAPQPSAGSNTNSDQTTEEIGVELMNEFLAQVGVKKGDVLLEEGSGLSRRDVITPDATVALLSYMNRSRWADVYRNALPIAGVDGTLQNRMKGTPAANNIRAKTGSLRFVYTLSGYVTTAAGEHLAFSIMLNNYNPAAAREAGASRASQPAPRDDLDSIAIMLAGFTGKSQ
jgi:serine-type D-Ala-D-Ala carboxypeptidase/endopeptidase (penicillin-binding protein 4)